MKPLMLNITLVVAFLATVFAHQSILSADSLSAEIRQAAEKITSVLADQEFESFTIVKFEDKTHGNFGPGIQAELIRAVETVNSQREKENKRSISILDNSAVKLNGMLQTVDDPNDLGTADEKKRLVAVELRVVLQTGGEDIYSGSFFVTRIRDIAQIEGLNFRADLNQDNRDIHANLRRTLDQLEEKPSSGGSRFHVDRTKIRSDVESPISVEIAAKSVLAGKDAIAIPRAPVKENGIFPFVPLGIGETYEITVHNDSAEEIAVGMTIDGIDQFTFSEDRDPSTGRPRYSHWIVAPKSKMTIRGWHKTSDLKRDDNVLSFLVTKYGEGGSRLVSHPEADSVGVITVSVSKSHLPTSAKSRGDAETGFGPPIKVEQTVVQRNIDPPHEFISIRYNR